MDEGLSGAFFVNLLSNCVSVFSFVRLKAIEEGIFRSLLALFFSSFGFLRNRRHINVAGDGVQTAARPRDGSSQVPGWRPRMRGGQSPQHPSTSYFLSVRASIRDSILTSLLVGFPAPRVSRRSNRNRSTLPNLSKPVWTSVESEIGIATLLLGQTPRETVYK